MHKTDGKSEGRVNVVCISNVVVDDDDVVTLN